MLAPLDGQILHALQLSPRASFRRIGDVVGVPERAVARRYRALRRDGVVRVVGLVNPLVCGESQWIVRVHTKPDDLPRLAEALARRPEVTHANVLSGSTELVCVVRAQLHDSGEGLLHRLPRTSSVLGIDVNLVLHVFGEPSNDVWTGYGHTLTGEQAAALTEAPRPSRPHPVPPADDDLPLLDALAADGRTPHSQLADTLGWSPARVKRRIAALEASATLLYDVDVLPERLGFRVHAMVWMKVPARHLADAAEQILAHREIASVMAVSGTYNMVAVVIAADVDQLYCYLTERLAAVDHLSDYAVSVRARRLKQAGSLISRGRLIPAAHS